MNQFRYILGYVTVYATYSANGRNDLIGVHAFDVKADGVTHSINGEVRAQIDAQYWPDYVADNEAAQLAQAKLEAANPLTPQEVTQ